MSHSLPATSYVKMIDVWMLVTIIFPFIEVCIQTYKEQLRNLIRSQTKIHPKQAEPGDQSEQFKLRICHYFSHWFLPMTSVTFAFCFWVLGLVNYNWPHLMQVASNKSCQ